MYNLGQMLRDENARRRLLRQIAGHEPPAPLRSIKMKITSQCNLRCEMCRYWQIADEQLPIEVMLAGLESAASLGCQKVHLSGGEVTLHPDLVETIRRGAELGMRVSLTTNGILMDKERARQWIDAGLRSASFSLDGANRKKHDRIRGVAGAFKRTVRAIRTLRREVDRKRSKLSLRVNVVLSRQNLDELAGLVRLGGELGVADVLPMPIDGKHAERPSPKEIEAFNLDVVPQVEELRRQFGMPINAGRLYPFGRTKRERELASLGEYALGYYDRHRCYVPYLHAFVSHTGDIYACCMTRGRTLPLGNIRNESLTDVFRGTAYQELRRSMEHRRLPACANCDQFLLENRLIESRLQEHQVPVTSPPVMEIV
jgi:radical SAM protein with 4Fe4S-binding SPASM domain